VKQLFRTEGEVLKWRSADIIRRKLPNILQTMNFDASTMNFERRNSETHLKIRIRCAKKGNHAHLRLTIEAPTGREGKDK
jgi:hypothetical protein